MLPYLLLIALALLPAADDGMLRVKTDVAGVEVFVDGNGVGNTPLSPTSVTVGTHQLTLTKAGYHDHEQQVQVAPGAPARVFVIMKPLPADPPKLPAQFNAIHQHSAGTACTGILTVTAEGIEYRSHDGRDVFHIPIQEVRSLSRSMGTAWWTSKPLKTPGEYAACRLEVSGHSYGFFAYEEDRNLAGTPAEDRVTRQAASAKTKELYDLIYRLWSEMLEQKQAKQAVK